MSSEKISLPDTTHSSEKNHSSRRNIIISALGRLGAICALGLASHTGGVVWTHIDTAKAETQNFSVEANLGLTTHNHIRLSSDVATSTNYFSGPLTHGIEARLKEVKPQAITNFAENNVNGIVPDEKEKGRLMTELSKNLIQSYATGFLITEIGLLGTYALGRRRISKEMALCSLLATSIAVGVNNYAATAYTTEHYLGHKETGLAPHLIGETNDTLKNLSEQSKRVQSYVDAFLQTQRNAAQPFNIHPPEVNPTVGPTFVMSSDWHNINWLSTLDSIAVSQQADALIFTGDMLDFGNIEEGEKVGFFKSIEDLHVPIIVVLGNHDKKSASDTALIDRLQKINKPDQLPKVILVEPDASSYNLISFGGFTISGNNDLRYYTDKDNPKENDAAIQNEANRYNQVFDKMPPDITLTHQATKALTTQQLIIGGHMHAFAIDGYTITNGSFTGGGMFGDKNKSDVLHQNIEDFSILKINKDCRPQELTTVTFTGLRDNNPNVVGVSKITGDMIKTKHSVKERSCTKETPKITQIPKK